LEVCKVRLARYDTLQSRENKATSAGAERDLRVIMSGSGTGFNAMRRTNQALLPKAVVASLRHSHVTLIPQRSSELDRHFRRIR